MCFSKATLKAEEVKGGRRFFIEEYNKTAYLYITSEDFSEMFCIGWLANYCKGPETIDMKSMKRGKPARMTRSDCSIPNGIKPIEKFAFNWTSETSFEILTENGVIAIVEDAFMPQAKFYSRYLTQSTNYGSPMKN